MHGAARLLPQVKNRNKKKQEMLPETRQALEDFYRPFNDKLAELLKDKRWEWRH